MDFVPLQLSPFYESLGFRPLDSFLCLFSHLFQKKKENLISRSPLMLRENISSLSKLQNSLQDNVRDLPYQITCIHLWETDDKSSVQSSTAEKPVESLCFGMRMLPCTYFQFDNSTSKLFPLRYSRLSWIWFFAIIHRVTQDLKSRWKVSHDRAS